MRRTIQVALPTAMLALTPTLPSSAVDAPAELLLTNGVFYSMEAPADGRFRSLETASAPSGSPPTVEVGEGGAAGGSFAGQTPVRGTLAVRDRRIVYLGPAAGAEALRGAATRVLDLGGRAVTPGLIDAHAHLAGLSDELGRVDLGGTTSYEQVIERVAAAAQELPSGSWIRGRGWDQNDWPNQDFPTHQALSRAVPDHPVWLTRVDGHATLVNAAAMERLGISAASTDPPGGRYLRAADGSPTGVLIDAAAEVHERRLPQPDLAERMRRLRLAAERCLALGLTTVTEMGADLATLEAYTALRERGELPLRVAVFLADDATVLDPWLERGPHLDPQARLVVRGIKLYADGALGSRGAALLEPYSDDPGNLGLLLSSHDHLVAVGRRAIERGFQLGVHAIGDRGGLLVLDAMEEAIRAAGADGAALRWRLEHAQVLRPQDIERLARLGIIASMQPTHATSDMPWAEARVGPRRILGAYAWRQVLAAGGRLALGSDFPVESADPRLGLYAAVTRRDLAGEPAGGWYPSELLDRDEALAGFTRDAAWSLFLDREVGTLEVGKRADLVVWEEDPLTAAAARLATVGIDYTVLDGEIVYARTATAAAKEAR